MTHPAAPVRAAPPPQRNRTMLGIGLMALGFFCYALSDATAKLLTQSLPPFQIVWFRQLGLLTVAVWFLVRRGPAILGTRRPGLQLSRGLVAALSSSSFIFAVSYVPLADAVAVSFVAPFLVTVMGALLLRETVGLRRWGAITVGFLGMLIVVRPGLGVFHPAMLLVVAAATLFRDPPDPVAAARAGRPDRHHDRLYLDRQHRLADRPDASGLADPGAPGRSWRSSCSLAPPARARSS